MHSVFLCWYLARMVTKLQHYFEEQISPYLAWKWCFLWLEAWFFFFRASMLYRSRLSFEILLLHSSKSADLKDFIASLRKFTFINYYMCTVDFFSWIFASPRKHVASKMSDVKMIFCVKLSRIVHQKWAFYKLPTKFWSFLMINSWQFNAKYHFYIW